MLGGLAGLLRTERQLQAIREQARQYRAWAAQEAMNAAGEAAWRAPGAVAVWHDMRTGRVMPVIPGRTRIPKINPKPEGENHG